MCDWGFAGREDHYQRNYRRNSTNVHPYPTVSLYLSHLWLCFVSHCQSGSILLLTGPPGCGKTATLQILARDLGFQVQEWTNPLSSDFTKEDLRSMFGHGKYVRGFSFYLFSPSSYLCGFSVSYFCFISVCHIWNQIHIHVSPLLSV